MNIFGKIRVLLLFWIYAMSTAYCITDYSRISMDVVVSVVDEFGNPLPESEVNIYFQHTYPQERKLGVSGELITKVYDGENAVKTKYSGRNSVGVRVEKEGFWQSQFSHRFTENERIDEKDGSPNGNYKKDFTVVLRRKKKPRPLYVQRVGVYVPGLNRPYGFDLEKSDWVAPHGKGVQSDFIFKMSRELKTFHLYKGDMVLTFSNPLDGLIEIKDSETPYSKLLLGESAPVEGYSGELKHVQGSQELDGSIRSITNPTFEQLDQIDGYWFRVRSEKPVDEEPVQARYGKILGHFSFGVRDEKPTVSFTYYFSPDLSRSLEWDGESLIPDANLQGVDKH